jgi:uncharacterized protein YcfL
MKKMVIPLLALFLLSGLQSCKKKEQPPSTFDLISRDSWTLKEIKTTRDGTVTSDQNKNTKVDLAPPGNYYWYSDDGSSVSDFGTWELTSENKKIHFVSSAYPIQADMDLLSISKDKKEWQFERDYNGSHYVYYYLLQRP